MSGVGMFLALIGVNAVSYTFHSLAAYCLEKARGKILYLLTIPTAIFSFPFYPVFEGIVNLYIKIAYDKFCEKEKEQEAKREEERRAKREEEEQDREIYREREIELAKNRAVKSERTAFAKRLLANDEPIEKIVRYTGLSAYDVRALMQ